MTTKYRRWGSMRNAKTIKAQVSAETLIWLDNYSELSQQEQIGYGATFEKLIQDFQGVKAELFELRKRWAASHLPVPLEAINMSHARQQ